MSLVFQFPGQSSRYPGMLEKPLAFAPETRPVLERASTILGRDLRRDFAEDAADPFARNEDIQVGVFVASHLWLVALTAAGVEAGLSLGLSLGEYNHLVHIGALAFEDALRLVRARGAAYDAGPRGFMVAAQPVTVEEAEAAIEATRHLGVVEIVSLNSPVQQVLGGDQVAVEAAARWLEDEIYAQPVVIERNLPMHASIFRPAADLYAPALAEAPFHAPRLPYLPNRLARIAPDPTRETFETLLTEHLYRPVRWRESIDFVHAERPEVTYVEVGPLRVLTNLLRSKWFRADKESVDGRDVTAESFAQTAMGLRKAHDGV